MGLLGYMLPCEALANILPHGSERPADSLFEYFHCCYHRFLYAEELDFSSCMLAVLSLKMSTSNPFKNASEKGTHP